MYECMYTSHVCNTKYIPNKAKIYLNGCMQFSSSSCSSFWCYSCCYALNALNVDCITLFPFFHINLLKNDKSVAWLLLQLQLKKKKDHLLSIVLVLFFLYSFLSISLSLLSSLSSLLYTFVISFHFSFLFLEFFSFSSISFRLVWLQLIPFNFVFHPFSLVSFDCSHFIALHWIASECINVIGILYKYDIK